MCIAGNGKSRLAFITDIFGVPRVPKCLSVNGRAWAGIAASS